MKQDKMSIQNLQNDSNYIILDNPFSSPKFVKQISKTEYKLAKTDTYTLKLFAELLSRLNYEVLENTTKANQIEIEVNIKDFLEQIGVEHNMGYNYVIEASSYLKTLIIQWKEDGIYKESVFVSYSEHNPKTGKVNLFVPQQFAKRVLDVGMKENFSFLKQNLFKLDNNQAIKLYQFFKQWQNKGRYETDLVRFKEQFGYNTSGYNKFSNLEKFVLEPATKEINEKTDIKVNYQTTGDNLDGIKPRVKGLIFYIKEKSKDTKQLPTGDHQQTAAPQPEATPTEPKTKPIERAKPQATTDKQSEADLVVLGEKLKLNQNQIQVIISELKGDYIRTFEVLQGCINENKAKTINSPFAYIIASLGTLGIGLYIQEQSKAQKKEADRIEKEKQSTIEKIQREYQERKTKQFTELYNKATDDTKQDFIDNFKTQTKANFNPYINQQGETKPAGIYKIGETIAETKGIGLGKRQAIFRNEVFEKYGYQIDYDQNDQVLILGLFENIEQNQAPVPTEPQATAPQEPSQTAEQIQEKKKRYQAQKRQPKPATIKTAEPQATEKIPPAPATIQEPTKNETTTEKPKTGIQKLFNFFK